jgi:probable rRNA maturation factor
MLDAGGLAGLARVARSQVLLGDVAISVPTALRQAAEKGVTPDAEVTFLLAHGLLHLLGLDHQTRAAERRMNARAEALVAAALASAPAPVDRLGADRPRTGRRRPRQARLMGKTKAKTKS